MQHMTLTQFLIEERRRFPEATGELNGLLLSVALACKSVGTEVAQGALAGALGAAGSTNVHGEAQQRLDVIANEERRSAGSSVPVRSRVGCGPVTRRVRPGSGCIGCCTRWGSPAWWRRRR